MQMHLFVTQPENARTGLPYSFDSFATPIGAFSHHGLPIELSLTGDDKISVSHIITKSGFVQYDLNAGFQ